MKCTNCGSELEADALFCTNCGHKIEDTQNETVQSKQAVQQPKQAAQPDQENNQLNYTVQPDQNGQPQAQKFKKKKIGKVIGVIAVVAVIVAAVGILFGSNGRHDDKGNEKAIAYYKDGALYYTANMDKEDSGIKVCNVDNNYDSEFMRYEIVDGYLFFYSRLNSDGAATLCRVELKKLKKDTEKNEKYIEEIDSNISNFSVINDVDHLVYRKQNGKLIYLNGKEEQDVAGDVSSYHMTNDKQAVLYTQSKNDETTTHVYDLKSGQDEMLNKGSVTYSAIPDSSDFIVYQQYQDDGTMDLYIADSNGRNDKVDSGIEWVAKQNNKDKYVYYMKIRKETSTAYSYVNDVYADADAGLKNPEVRDYLENCTRDDVYKDITYDYDDIDKAEFAEYYNQYPEEFLDWYMSYDSELGLYYNYFYDENDIQKYYYYDELTNQWYRLKSQEYDTAKEQYEQAEYRIELREELQNTNIDSDMYDLYIWKDGEEPQKIAENVSRDYLVTAGNGNVVVYKKNDITAQKVSIDDIDSVYDVMDMASNGTHYAQDNDTNYYYAGGEEKELDLDGRINRIEISPNQKNIMMESTLDDVRKVDWYTVDGSELKNGASMGEDTCGAVWADNDICYYFKDVIDGYGDLYRFYNGKSEKILSNIYTTVYIYDDENCVYSKYHEDEDFDLRMKKGDKDEIKVTNSVSDYTYINEKRIVYRKNESLYVYTGKDEDKKIARNVSSYQCEVQKECTFVYTW